MFFTLQSAQLLGAHRDFFFAGWVKWEVWDGYCRVHRCPRNGKQALLVSPETGLQLMGLIPANTNFYRAGKHVEEYMTMTTVTSKANTTAPSQVLASTNCLLYTSDAADE